MITFDTKPMATEEIVNQCPLSSFTAKLLAAQLAIRNSGNFGDNGIWQYFQDLLIRSWAVQ